MSADSDQILGRLDEVEQSARRAEALASRAVGFAGSATRLAIATDARVDRGEDQARLVQDQLAELERRIAEHERSSQGALRIARRQFERHRGSAWNGHEPELDRFNRRADRVIAHLRELQPSGLTRPGEGR